MAEDSKIKEFPDISSKLTAPSKKSQFERQKAEVEAKRAREKAETAAVYEDFVKSFEDSDATLPSSSIGSRLDGGGLTSIGSGFGGPPKRHYPAPPSGPAAGRGGLGGSRGGLSSSGPGSLGPLPPSLSRKRAHNGSQPTQRDSSQGLFAFENSSAGSVDAATAFQASDEEDEEVRGGKATERAPPKPTLHVSSLPPGSSPAVIKALLPSNVVVDAVRILPPSGPGSLERKSLSAIITLAKDTPVNEIDSTVNALSNKYLGWGFYLSISRHLSSAAVGSGPGPIGIASMLASMPFGAKPIPSGPGGPLNRAPPPGTHRGGYAPPNSYAPTGPGQYGRGAPPVQVAVNPPADLKQLKLIHKTLEALLTHGPEFEALLMSRPEVHKDEDWAWLWDPRSAGGVWYRWRLWEILTGAQRRGRDRIKGMTEKVFDGGALWAPPEKGLRFEYTRDIDEFVSDPEYDSSEDDDSGDEGQGRHHHHRSGAPPMNAMGGLEGEEKAYLNPLRKTKLTHLLARLPTTNAKLRKGDVARVTAFAIEHAGEGADEVVDMIVSNIERPFAYTRANPDRQNNVDNAEAKLDEDAEDKERAKEKEDTSASKLIALYVVSDILSSSSTSGVRHAWRYRQLFETVIKQRKIFENLGRLEKELLWGRLRAEKWRRSVNGILTLWEGWCVFPQASQEHFVSVFANPPLTAAEEAANAAANVASGTTSNGAAKSKWKTVDVKGQHESSPRPLDLEAAPPAEEMDVDADVDGEPLLDDDELDGKPMAEDDDLDGMAMEDDEDGTEGGGEEEQTKVLAEEPAAAAAMGFKIGLKPADVLDGDSGSAPRRKPRPKAEDMFADSDEE
ncbi:MAG: hypothetical protein M1835_002896 [Candelina submexicana]|nr:MAG: hypothetical protein M1835_002896 [Candelina submexicana]